MHRLVSAVENHSVMNDIKASDKFLKSKPQTVELPSLRTTTTYTYTKKELPTNKDVKIVKFPTN